MYLLVFSDEFEDGVPDVPVIEISSSHVVTLVDTV